MRLYGVGRFPLQNGHQRRVPNVSIVSVRRCKAILESERPANGNKADQCILVSDDP